MSETDHTPKMFPKLIQLMSHGTTLYALDENGTVWWKDTQHGGVWRLAIQERVE